MTRLCFRGECYSIPECWTLFVADGWTFRREDGGFHAFRLGLRAQFVRAA